MGIVRQSASISYSANSINALFDFFESFQSDLITSIDRANGDIVFDDKATLHFFLYPDYYQVRMNCIFNGSTSGTLSNYQYSQCRMYCSDNLIIMKFISSNSDKPLFIAEKIGDRFFVFFGSGSTNSLSLDITEKYLTEYNLSTSYCHKSILPYALENSDHIDITDDYLFLSGNIKNVKDTNTLSCSNVTADSVITIEGKNYYSIGAYTLVQLDNLD